MFVKLIRARNHYCDFLFVFHLCILGIPHAVESAVSDDIHTDKPTLVVDYGFGNDKTHFNSRDNVSQRVNIVLNSTGREITINCSAPYPIDLSFSGHESNRDFETIAYKQGETFFIKATTPGFESATGNYSCFSVQNPKLFSSLYIYVTPTIPSVLLNRGQTIVVQPEFNKRNILIPCPSSNPSACKMIRLQKYTEGSAIWEDFTPTACNSKFGFLIRNDHVAPGLYKCTGINITDQVAVVVEPYRTFRVTPNERIFLFEENATFAGKCESSEEVKLVHAQVQMKSEILLNVSSQNNSLTKFVIEFETVPLKSSNHNQIITCEQVHSSSPGLVYTWVLQFKTGSQANQQSRTSPVISQACGAQNKGILKFFQCYSWTNCQMRRCQRYDHNCDTDDELRNVTDGILQCMSNVTEPVSMIYFKGLTSKNIITDWRKSQKNDWLTLHVEVHHQILDKNSSHSGELTHKTHKFICEGTKFVFAHDFQWKMVVAHQATTKMVDVPAENVTHLNSPRGQSIISSELTMTELPSNFIEISCEARIWNSTEAETVKMSAQDVREAVARQKLITSTRNSGIFTPGSSALLLLNLPLLFVTTFVVIN